MAGINSVLTKALQVTTTQAARNSRITLPPAIADAPHLTQRRKQRAHIPWGTSFPITNNIVPEVLTDIYVGFNADDDMLAAALQNIVLDDSQAKRIEYRIYAVTGDIIVDDAQSWQLSTEIFYVAATRAFVFNTFNLTQYIGVGAPITGPENLNLVANALTLPQSLISIRVIGDTTDVTQRIILYPL